MSFNDEEKQIDAKLSAAWAQHRPAIIVVLALLLVSLVMCSRAHAGTATVSWTHPTTYTDGSALALTDISQTRIEYGTCAGTAFGTKAGEQIATGTATTVTITNLAVGTWCFRGYTTAKGVESGPSVVASKVVPQAATNPPTLSTITTVAYSVIKWRTQYALIPAGTVPLGTACQSNMQLAGLYEIPTSAVKARFKAAVYWGRCA